MASSRPCTTTPALSSSSLCAYTRAVWACVCGVGARARAHEARLVPPRPSPPEPVGLVERQQVRQLLVVQLQEGHLDRGVHGVGLDVVEDLLDRARDDAGLGGQLAAVVAAAWPALHGVGLAGARLQPGASTRARGECACVLPACRRRHAHARAQAGRPRAGLHHLTCPYAKMVQLKPSITSCTMGTTAVLYSFSWCESQPNTCAQRRQGPAPVAGGCTPPVASCWRVAEGWAAGVTLSNLKVRLICLPPTFCSSVTSRSASLVVMTCGVLSASSRSLRGLRGWWRGCAEVGVDRPPRPAPGPPPPPPPPHTCSAAALARSRPPPLPPCCPARPPPSPSAGSSSRPPSAPPLLRWGCKQAAGPIGRATGVCCDQCVRGRACKCVQAWRPARLEKSAALQYSRGAWPHQCWPRTACWHRPCAPRRRRTRWSRRRCPSRQPRCCRTCWTPATWSGTTRC